VRTVGSGNLGATNVGRLLGPRWFAVCFLLDFAKGFVPAFVLGRIGVARYGTAPEISLLYGFAAVAGHVWPVYLGFRGGKGVATASGAVVGLVPKAAGVAALGFLVVLLIWRFVSLGSIVAAVLLPLAYLLIERPGMRPDFTFWALCAIALLVVAKHRSNVRRIVAGTEHRVGRRGADEGVEGV
jgi:glycerol-3-phosphate acyltransferase PlsY